MGFTEWLIAEVDPKQPMMLIQCQWLQADLSRAIKSHPVIYVIFSGALHIVTWIITHRLEKA
jgi:hypothetical protein